MADPTQPYYVTLTELELMKWETYHKMPLDDGAWWALPYAEKHKLHMQLMWPAR